MKVFLLCAGLGNRLRPLTDDRPKCMVPLHNVPLLQHQVNVLTGCGLNDLFCLTGYLADKITVTQPIKKIHNPLYATTNMVRSLFQAREFLKGEIIIGYGDIVYSEGVLKQLLSSPPAEMTVVADNQWKSYWEERFDDPLSDAETFKINVNGNITELGKKTKSFEDIQGQYIGLMKFSAEGTHKLQAMYDHLQDTLSPEKFNNLYMTDIIQRLIEDSTNVKACMIERSWFEVDDFRDLQIAEKHTRTLDYKLVINP